MKTRIAALLLAMTLSGCALLTSLHLKNPDGSVNVQQLLAYAQDGINADCQLGINHDVCTFGMDAINLAKGKSPAEVKQILLDVEVKFPQVKPYVDFVVAVIN